MTGKRALMLTFQFFVKNNIIKRKFC